MPKRITSDRDDSPSRAPDPTVRDIALELNCCPATVYRHANKPGSFSLYHGPGGTRADRD